MGWWSTSSSRSDSSPDTGHPAQQTSARTLSPSPESPAAELSAAQDSTDFHNAFPHLAPQNPPQSPSEPSPSPEYPDTMSCRQAFDSAFYCQSLGGKFNDIYRYGELRSCSEHWSDFWFCMRIKSKAESVKRELVMERYKVKEDKIRSGPNSEDVWRARRPHERLQNPFQDRLD